MPLQVTLMDSPKTPASNTKRLNHDNLVYFYIMETSMETLSLIYLLRSRNVAKRHQNK